MTKNENNRITHYQFIFESLCTKVFSLPETAFPEILKTFWGHFTAG